MNLDYILNLKYTVQLGNYAVNRIITCFMSFEILPSASNSVLIQFSFQPNFQFWIWLATLRDVYRLFSSIKIIAETITCFLNEGAGKLSNIGNERKFLKYIIYILLTLAYIIVRSYTKRSQQLDYSSAVLVK